MRSNEPRVSGEQVEVLCLLNSFQAALAKLFNHTLLALADFAHVDVDIAVMHAIVRRAPREISDASAIEHRLGWRAAIVDARAADVSALDERSLPTRLGQRRGQRLTSLTRSNDDGVVLIGQRFR